MKKLLEFCEISLFLPDDKVLPKLALHQFLVGWVFPSGRSNERLTANSKFKIDGIVEKEDEKQVSFPWSFLPSVFCLLPFALFLERSAIAIVSCVAQVQPNTVRTLRDVGKDGFDSVLEKLRQCIIKES